jgi:hypothetical protein
MLAICKKEIKMNNLYHWHDERMVDLERQEIHRELAQANLLREAGPSATGWLTRAARAFLNLLRTRGGEPRDHHSMKRASYPSHSEKAAQ